MLYSYMYTFIRGINIQVCQPFLNLREMVADYVQLTKRPLPITAQEPGICSFQGDPGWVPKRPPPQISKCLL